MWEDDEKFVDWLDSEELGTDDDPLDDEVLELMHRAWKAGQLSHLNDEKDDFEEDFDGDFDDEEVEELDFEG